MKNERETEIAIPGARIETCRARVLSASDVHAHNDFANPRTVEPHDQLANVRANGTVVFQFVPASVTLLKITLV